MKTSRDVMLSVVIPVFNERATLRKLLEKVRAVPIRKQIVIVDDCSTDGTREILRAIAASGDSDPLNSIVGLFHEANAGKGSAVRTGLAHVTGDITLIQDADLEYSPHEYPQLIAPILSGRADVVFGSRFLGETRRVLYFRHTIGNKILTWLSNLSTDLNLSDMETCYKVFRTDVARRLNIRSKRFGIEPEIVAKVARLGCRIYEVPITYDGREYWEGKKIGWRDGVSAIWTILKYAVIDDLEHSDPDYEALKRLRQTRREDERVWRLVAAHVGDRVLDVGSGIRNSTMFLRGRERIVLAGFTGREADIVKNSIARFSDTEVDEADLGDAAQRSALRRMRLDTALCLDPSITATIDIAHLADVIDDGNAIFLTQFADAAGDTTGLQRWRTEQAMTADLGAYGLTVTSVIRLPPERWSQRRLRPLRRGPHTGIPPRALALVVARKEANATRVAEEAAASVVTNLRAAP